MVLWYQLYIDNCLTYHYISESENTMDSLGLLIFEPVDEIRSAHWVFGNSTGILTQTTAKILKFDSGVVTLKKPSPPNNAEYMQAVIDFGNTVYKSPEIKV